MIFSVLEYAVITAQKGQNNMRFEDGRIDQFVSEEKTIPQSERENLIREFKNRGRGMASVAFKYFKNELKGDDSEEIFTEDEQRAFMARAQDLAQNGYQDAAGSKGGKKPSIVPLIVVIAAFVIIIGAAISGNALAAFGAFFLVFSALGFYSAFTKNSRGRTFYGGTNSGSSKTAGIAIGIIGLAGAIPLFFAKMLGTSGAFMLMAVCLFAAVGIAMFVGFFMSLDLKSRKYKEEITANCVGYARIIREESSHSRGHHRGGFSFMTSPVFEYTYQGREYRGIYDRMIDGLDADVNMGPVDIRIDPDHPEDIYHSSKPVMVKGLCVGLICIALTAVLGFFFITRQLTAPKVPEVNMGPKTIFAMLFGSDDQKEELMESFGDGLKKSVGTDSEITDEIVAHMAEQYNAAGEWYYELAKVERYDVQDDKKYNIIFEDPAFPQIGKNGKPDGLGDTWIVFYTLYEYESNGEKKIGKSPFFDANPKEFTYTGTHKAYEG